MNKGTFGFSRTGTFHPNELVIGPGSIPGNQGSTVIGHNNTGAGFYNTIIGHNNIAVPFTKNSSSVATTSGYGYTIGSQLIGAWNFSTAASYACVGIGILNNQTGATLNNSTATFKGNPVAATNIGSLSTAVGVRNLTAGVTSTAIGFNNTASASGALALGRSNTASGSYCVAAGYNNTTSNNYSICAGYSNVASAANSIAIGYKNSMNSASLNCQLVGRQNFGTSASFSSVLYGILNGSSGATLNASTGAITGTVVAGTVGRLASAFGVKNTVSGNQSTALGYLNTASGNFSTSLGSGNTASGTYALAVGYNNTSGSGYRGAAIGWGNTASGNYSYAIGYNNSVTQLKSVGVGTSNTVTGTLSLSAGYHNTSSGARSTACGYQNIAAGANSVVAGYKNSMNAASLNCQLVGRENFGNATSFAAVAFGILNNQQSGTLNTSTGAITGTPAAAATIGRLTTAVGLKNLTAGHLSSAIGYSNTSSGVQSSALGYSNTASATGAVAIGFASSASGSYSVAFGCNATASNNYSIVLASGTNLIASSAVNQFIVGDITVACFGNGVTATTANNVKITVTGGSGTDIIGGKLTLASGVSTGNAVPAPLYMQTGALGGSSGTTAQTLIDRKITGASKVIANNTVTTICNVTVGSNTVAAGIINYCVEVFDGTDLVMEVGSFSYTVSNKAATIANNVISTKYGNQLIFTGVATLVVTWTITAANPALLQLNANASITPSAGYPRVTYEIINLTQQGIAPQ